jgi:ArsR family transcriptional regulator, arsenate/arsenite/antimonite-responsive transcriptional repressor
MTAAGRYTIRLDLCFVIWRNIDMGFRDVLPALRALGDEGRLRALFAVRHRELCVCQITELLSLAPSTVSKHMAILRQAQLVDSRKEGRWIYYRMSLEHSTPAIAGMVNGLLASLESHPDAVADAQRLNEILAMDPEVLCRRQCRPAGEAAEEQETATACC